MSATPTGPPRERSRRPVAQPTAAAGDGVATPAAHRPVGSGAVRLGSLIALLGLIAFVHLWIVSGGRWSFETNPSGTLYRRQAEAFRAGQFALLEAPPAALLALPDPYDGRAWLQVLTTPDLSLYDGRFYLYFGPFPAVVLAAGSLVGLQVADGVLGLAFDLALVALFAAALGVLRRRLVPDGSWLLDRLGLIAFGLGAPLLFMLGRLSGQRGAGRSSGRRL